MVQAVWLAGSEWIHRYRYLNHLVPSSLGLHVCLITTRSPLSTALGAGFSLPEDPSFRQRACG